jgi:hypothetical protein
MDAKFYIHNSKESNWNMASELGKDEDEAFMENFRYAGYEVEFDVKIDKSGHVFATHVNGVALVEPVKI